MHLQNLKRKTSLLTHFDFVETLQHNFTEGQHKLEQSIINKLSNNKAAVNNRNDQNHNKYYALWYYCY